MNAALDLSQLPTRLAAGAFVLNSGLSKRDLDHETAKHLHSMAAEAYPILSQLEPEVFAKVLSISEIGLGVLLMTPRVPKWFSGAALTAFSGGLLGLYMRLPGMREDGGLRPTRDGIPLAKDVWMAAIGASLLVGAAAEAVPWSRTKRAARRRTSAAEA